MIKEIKMPDLGTTSAEIEIVKWLKKPGELVALGEDLLEVETDKATMNVESFVSGQLKKIIIPEGECAQTGDVIAYIGDENDQFE